METTTIKNRTPSRCREWERKRRNKFNDAIARLGEVVKKINKANETTSKSSEDVQYPKIEIVEKAIICLTNCSQEKTQLKADILALQVKLDGINQLRGKKDASTQVFTGINKKRQNGKYVKVLMLQKSKRTTLKEKSVLKTNVSIESKIENQKSTIKSSTQNLHKLPVLLPKTNVNDKKGPENTFVVLSGAPYIFPQRPLLFPTVPPAFVLVDSNLQTLNKPSFPLVNRNNGDVTKTTMVNILPISAYSRPLSATKTKKGNVRSRTDIARKAIKKSKQAMNVAKELILNNEIKEVQTGDENVKDNEAKKTVAATENKKEDPQLTKNVELVNHATNEINNSKIEDSQLQNNIQETKSRIKNNEAHLEQNLKTKLNELIETSKVTNPPKCKNTVTVEKGTGLSVTSIIVQNANCNDGSTDGNSNSNKILAQKAPLTEDKNKENKLPTILDTTLCESTVDGGNARLELAEEFLAASPTAAFLMSFPLVSGNRADSPAEEPHNAIQVNSKDNNPRRQDVTPQPIPYFEKLNANDTKVKSLNKSHMPSNNIHSKQTDHHKYIDSNIQTKQVTAKSSNSTVPLSTNVSTENPFLNLPMSSFVPTNCTLADSTFGLDFDCNINKPVSSQPTSYVSNSNLFYKSDPFSTVKSTIYSTSSISSGHEFNSFGLYPCAMEKYTSKSKSDYPNVEDNLMKIGSSRLTYDIDLGWSHKSLDFVSCTSASNTFNKDNILTTATGTYSTPYNPFNPEFHVPLVTNSNKKDNSTNKPNSSFAETITNFYSQPANLWSEDVPFYSNNSVPKTLTTKQQNYLHLDHVQTNVKPNISKQYETKQNIERGVENMIKPTNIGVGPQLSTKKSPSKMHINWMTSEIRPMQNHCNSEPAELKERQKPNFTQLDNIANKKQDHNESYFPISMHNFSSQTVQEELQVWPSARPAGTTEISIEPPPINLPTLVGDLALGPHDKKKNTDGSNRGVPQSDIQNCSNFFSVTQLMNRSTNNISSRYQGPNLDALKPIPAKQNLPHVSNDTSRKTMSRLESHLPQPCYAFNESKSINSYETMGQYSQAKVKTNKSDKSSKVQKNNYSAEALIRGGTCTQKLQDSNTKFITSHKYNDFTVPQDSGVAQVSHFPPILDYSDNSYTGQQFSGTTLYNSTTNTISNSFYSNFMPGSSNLMSGNYTSGPFSGDFIDYNQSAECNYTNHKYDEFKMRNNPAVYQQDKLPSNYKSSRRESAAKHKLECSKKESSKKYQNKRVKLNTEIEDWNDTSNFLWQNKTPTKKHPNLMSEELPFPNYVSNQMPAQYQHDFFNSHLMPSNMQTVGHNVDRSLASFPATSRANFNLSTIFPEITMKVQ